MRLIDADGLKERLKEYCIDGDKGIEEYYEIMGIDDCIDNAPTVDAVEIVRCKDCKWIRKAGTLMGENPEPIYGCHHTGVYVFEDGYCDVGERKEE